MRRISILALTVAVLAAATVMLPTRAVAQKRQRVDLPAGTVVDTGARPVVSVDGSVGFLAPAVGDTLVAFALRTGEVLGRLSDLGAATSVAISEDGSRRLLALAIPNDPDGGTPSAVVVVDASDPSALAVVSTFTLPATARLAPGARAELARGQRFGIVTIVAPVAALISFDVASGQQIGALTLDATPDRIALVDAGQATLVAVASAEANEVAVVTVDESGVLLPLSTFAAPDDAPISTTNNVAFAGSGQLGYVASLKGRALMSFSLESGELVDRIATDGSSAAIAVYHTPDRDLVAVANVSRPGGDPKDDVAPTPDEPLGLPAAVVVEADASGKLVERSRFHPETGEEIAPANNPEFNADGSVVYVPSRTGALYSVDAATGAKRGREALDHRVQSITSAPLAEAVAVVSAGGSEGRVDVVSPTVEASPAPPETPEDAGSPRGDRAEADETSKDEEDRAGGPPVIERVSPMAVQAGRRRDLAVTVVGTGFGPGATIVVGATNYSAVVSPNGKRANFTLSASLLASPGTVPIVLRNPDGALSNTYNLDVVSPYAPVVAKVSPAKIDSGSGGVDLKIRGDHFRDGAVASVVYTDASGTQQTVALTTYRLSFTSLVARLPKRLTVRAEQFALVVTDRDGAASSQPAEITVVGPTITSVEPEGVVAGRIRGDNRLALHITGENFHENAVVYVRRPSRGEGNDTLPFLAVPPGNVRRKSATKLVVKLTPTDLAYSGTLVVRVVNPVPGERRRNGDAAMADFAVSGPAVSGSTPGPILAGSDAFVLKLEGTNFRPGASVKLARTDSAGEVTRKVLVDTPNLKDRMRVNVEMNTPELLRLVARPGTLQARVINPSLGKGDPSAAFTIQVVGPTITEYVLVPSENDPTEYRLALTGQYFADGATVQLYTSTGEPAGRPVEARFKSDTELVVRLGRQRVTDLRTFKVVVLNPGGPYNAEGVPSNPIDVTVN
jgi:hypothetical protein